MDDYIQRLEARKRAQHDQYYAKCYFYKKYFPRCCIFDCPRIDLILQYGINRKAQFSIYFCKTMCEYCKKPEGYQIDAYQCTHPDHKHLNEKGNTKHERKKKS